MTSRYQESEYSDTSGLGWLVAGGLALLAVLLAGYLLLEVVDRDHAVEKHGIEAEQIRKCLDTRGADQLWKFTSHRREDHFIQCARLAPDSWGIRIIQRLKDGSYLERTSFIVKNGTLFEMIEYVTARAVRYDGELP